MMPKAKMSFREQKKILKLNVLCYSSWHYVILYGILEIFSCSFSFSPSPPPSPDAKVNPNQGTLTELEGSVQFTSSLSVMFCQNVTTIFNIKVADLN
jgi:hypothetical protein